MKRYQVLGLFLIYIPSVFCTPANQVKKIFHHQAKKFNASIEMGSIVLYLNQKPKISVTTKTVGHNRQSIYFLPHVNVESEVKNMIDRINQEKDRPYTVTIQEVTAPTKGLQLTFTYNPRNVGISYELFDSITLQKGVVFRLFNKNVLSRIQASGRPIIKTAANSIPRVVIDCGHGGADNGAVGCSNVREKDVNLQVGLQVAQLLRDENISVDLVRQSDRTCLLDERTTFANKKDANLFVSIHSNASLNKTESGIETYCLSPSLFSCGETTLSYAQQSFAMKQLRTKYAQSNRLACVVHQSLMNTVQSVYQVKDRKIKKSVAQVLLGTTMPAVLVELGFLTHQKESVLLIQKQYQSRLACGIASGILSYLQKA